MYRGIPLIAIIAVSALLPAAARAQAAAPEAAAVQPQVRVHAHMVLIDRTQATRAGLRYAQAGKGRIVVQGGEARRGRGTPGAVVVGGSGEVAGVPVSAFVELVRQRRALRSETRTFVTARSGSTASVSSGSVQVGVYGQSRTQGPELVVRPTVLADGSIQLDVRAALRDEVVGPFGWYGADGSPVRTATSVIVLPGEDATVGNVQTATERRDVGLLSWQDESGTRDVIVVLRAEILP